MVLGWQGASLGGVLRGQDRLAVQKIKTPGVYAEGVDKLHLWAGLGDFSRGYACG
jgi:hypothetical protein